MWWAPPKGTHFWGRKLLLLEQKKHQRQCVNDDPMIPSSFLSSTGNTYGLLSTLKSSIKSDRSTCQIWEDGRLAPPWGVTWNGCFVKQPKFHVWFIKTKNPLMFFFENPLFCYLSTTSSLCEMFVPFLWKRINKISRVFVVLLHIQPAKVFVDLCKKESFPTVDGRNLAPPGMVLNPCV